MACLAGFSQMKLTKEERTDLYSPEVMMCECLTKKEVGLEGSIMEGRYSISKKGRIYIIFQQLYSAVYRRTYWLVALLSFRSSQFLLRQSTNKTKKSSVQCLCLKGLSLRVCMYIESAISITASFCVVFSQASLLPNMQPQLGYVILGKRMQLPLEFMQKLGLELSMKPWSKYLACISLQTESPAILQTLYPSVGLKDSMSLVGSTLPLLLLWKQSMCLFFMWRQRAGQLRYCLVQKHSYLGRSLLYFDWDLLRRSMFSFQQGEGQFFYINLLWGFKGWHFMQFVKLGVLYQIQRDANIFQ